MRIFIPILLLVVGACTADFDSRFTSETLRVDYYSSGNRTEETAELISLTRTGEWAGPRNNLVNPYNLGDYRIILRDRASGDTLYLQGFSTLFGEWRTTEEALTGTERYYNSKSIPMPRRKAEVIIDCRDRWTGLFSTMTCIEFNPADIRNCGLPVSDVTVLYTGNISAIPSGKTGGPQKTSMDNSGKVDLTFIAEGYRSEERDKFLSDAARFTEALFACPPFDSLRQDFNVRAVMTVSDSSGVDSPGLGIYRSTALNSNYYTFGTDRYLTTADMKAVADAVWDVPTDAIFILVNESIYGGGGIYNFYAIGSSDNRRTLDVFIHEFGHSFGALADEYFSSSTAYAEDAFYPLDREPWEPNITTLVDFDSKWRHWRDSLYEGGGYLPKGIWRPADHCMMRDYAPFCPVCTRSILRNTDWLCDR